MAKIFVVEYENQADAAVFMAKYENQSDLSFFEVDYANQAQGDALWYFVDYTASMSGSGRRKRAC